MEGKLHIYHPDRKLVLFEYTTGPTSGPPPSNVLLFIGGLYDNFLNVGYVDDLSRLFKSSKPTWR